MKINNLIIAIPFLITCSQAMAWDIAHGTLKGIKVYDYVDSKVTKLYFDSNATHQDEESCEGVANITHSLHSDATTQKMLSIALSGYMAGKKVRAYSKSSGSCEVELISLQEAYF